MYVEELNKINYVSIRRQDIKDQPDDPIHPGNEDKFIHCCLGHDS